MFRILIAALTISLIACSIHRIPGMVKTARNPRVDVGPAFFEHAPQHEAIVVRRSADETRAVVEGVLQARRYRTLTTDDGTVHLYADRFRWAPFAGLIGHLSLVVILAGAIVGGMFGFRDSQFTLAEGQTLPVVAEAGPRDRARSTSPTPTTPTTGSRSTTPATSSLYKDGAEVDRHVVRVNDPLRYDGLTFYQAFFGAAAIDDRQGRRGQDPRRPRACRSPGRPTTTAARSARSPSPARPTSAGSSAPWAAATPTSSRARCGRALHGRRGRPGRPEGRSTRARRRRSAA